MNQEKKAVIDSINQCITQLREIPVEPSQQSARKIIVEKGGNIVQMAVANGLFSEEEETVYWDLLVLAFDPIANKGF